MTTDTRSAIRTERKRRIELIRDWIRQNETISISELQKKLEQVGITLSHGQVWSNFRQAQTLLIRELIFGEKQAGKMFGRRR